MFINVKNIKADEMIHTKLEVTNVMYGAFDGDDRCIVSLPDGDSLIFSPMGDYLISEYVEYESPEPQIDIEAYKASAIARTKQWLESELDRGMPFEKNGEVKMYTVTREKQALLMGQLMTGSMLREQPGATPENIILKWNASGEEHTDWTLAELSLFAFAVQRYVEPFVTKQQHAEVSINKAVSVGEVDEILQEFM